MIKCPKCESEKIDRRNHGTKVLGTVGFAAGGILGYLGKETGEKVGEKVGAAIGKRVLKSETVGEKAGSIIGGIAGAGTGMLLGEKLGNEVDKKILNNYICLKCGYTFNKE